MGLVLCGWAGPSGLVSQSKRAPGAILEDRLSNQKIPRCARLLLKICNAHSSPFYNEELQIFNGPAETLKRVLILHQSPKSRKIDFETLRFL